MPWAFYLAALPSLAEDVPPAANITDGIQTYILGYGVLGVVALVLAWVVYKGSFVPSRTVTERIEAARADLLRENERIAAERVAAVEAGRVDLLRENAQLREDRTNAYKERDAALNIAQVQLVPLLTSFVATSQSLIPLLQELVRKRER